MPMVVVMVVVMLRGMVSVAATVATPLVFAPNLHVAGSVTVQGRSRHRALSTVDALSVDKSELLSTGKSWGADIHMRNIRHRATPRGLIMDLLKNEVILRSKGLF